MSTATEGTLVELPIASVYPDPVQPRLHPDAELAGSLRSVGQLQPIRVERAQPLDAIDVESGKSFVQIAAESGYMIQDGERRHRGLLAAGKRSVLAVIVPPATEGQRLLRQIIANTGKPLTPMEEARAYRRIMASEGWSANRLAQELGKPRSTVGDRVRALELDPVWIDLMDAGVLQLSHAPILHPYAAVPHDYQVKAAANLPQQYAATEAFTEKRPLTMQELEHAIFGCFRDFVVALRDVRSYRGPTIEVKPNSYGAKAKYAADPALWRPIVKRAKKQEKAKRASGSSGYNSHSSNRASWVKALPAGVQERSSSEYYPEPNAGEAKVLSGDGWDFGGWSGQRAFDPRIVLQRIAPEQLIKVVGKYSVTLVTTDLEAMQAARASVDERVATLYQKRTASVRSALERAIAACPVEGAGCAGLATWALRMAADRPDVDPLDLIQILDLADLSLIADRDQLWDAVGGEDDGIAKLVADMVARGTIETFCSLLAAVPTLEVDVPSSETVRREVVKECAQVNPKWGAATQSKKQRRAKQQDVEIAIAPSVEAVAVSDEQRDEPAAEVAA